MDIAEQMVSQNAYETCSDLDLGYWHLPVHPDHKKYVGCHVILGNGEIIYLFCMECFVFGHQICSVYFQKNLKTAL